MLLNSVAVIKKRMKGTISSPLKRFRFSRGSIPITDEIKAIPINMERDIIIGFTPLERILTGFKVINGSDFLNLDNTQERNAVQKAISLGVVVWGNTRRKR